MTQQPADNVSRQGRDAHTTEARDAPPSSAESREEVEAVFQSSHVFEEQDEFQLQIAKECFENGITYWGNGEHDIAMIEFRRSLEINEEMYGRLSHETAKCYLWVGSIHWHKKEFDKALDHFCRSFRIRMQLAGFVKENCGIVVNWINRVIEAKEVKDAEKDWRIIMQAIERERKGERRMAEGKYTAAIAEYRSVIQLELSRRGMKANTPGRPIADIADLHSKIAQVHVAEKDYVRAMMEYRQAMSIYTAAFGRDQQFTTQCYKDITAVGHSMGFRDETVTKYVESIHDCMVEEQYADSHMEGKNYTEALKLYEGVMKREGSCIGMRLVQNALILAKMGRALRKMGQTDKAVMQLCKALGIFDEALGSQHRLTIGTMKVIRDTLSEKQNFIQS
jgi:tetratricopeptide (TPR) repeat protein